jgi:hypothetical protein
MDLVQSVKSERPYVVIKQEQDERGMRRYRRMDTGKIVPQQSIEFLQEPADLILHDGKSTIDVVIRTEDPNIIMNANSIVLGKNQYQGRYAYSFCKARL